MAKLIIFERLDYTNLKALFESEGKNIITFSEVFKKSDQSFGYAEFDEEKHVLDISELYSIEQISTNFLFLFQQFVLDYLIDATFITDYDTQEFREKLGYIFTIEEVSFPKKGSIEQNDTQEILAPSKKLITDLSAQQITTVLHDFSNLIIGHDKFKSDLLEKTIEFKLFNLIGENNIYSLFLMGESGVGKTEVAKQLHKLLGGKAPLAKINFGNYSSQDALNSLIGSPRGYIGSDSGELFDKIRNSDTGIVLIDEFEKATPAVYNYFLEILENGVATSMIGEAIDLNGYIFIFTSNVNSDMYELKFSPELRSRFNYVSSFSPLTDLDKSNYLFTRFSKYVDELNRTFKKRLKKPSKEWLESRIIVSQFQNMRILNTEIRNLFMQYVKEQYSLKTDKIWM